MSRNYTNYAAVFLLTVAIIVAFIRWDAYRQGIIGLSYFLNVGTPLILAFALWQFGRRAKGDPNA